jgi:hypothetical protein
LPRGVAHGEGAVLVVPGDLGQRLLAAGRGLGDAHQVDAVGGVGVAGLTPDRVDGAGDLTPGVVVVALELGAAVVQHAGDGGGLVEGAGHDHRAPGVRLLTRIREPRPAL